MKKILWEKMRRTEFEELAKADAVVIIPVASTEQHGDHLPVNTDASCCSAIAQRAAQAIDEFPVLVLPTIWTGYSPHHMAYPGAITLKYHTFVELLTQVAASVHAHGFKKILILNGHGGNSPIVASMRTKLAAEEGVSSAAYNCGNLPSVPEQLMKMGVKSGHSGDKETSIQLFLQPELVNMEAAAWIQGVHGDPSGATREKGERIINVVVSALIKLLRDYHCGKLADDISPLSWLPELLSYASRGLR